MPSRNLTRYLAARATGTPVEQAADMAGFSLTEARLTETAVAKGELELPHARAPAHARTREDQSTKEETIMPDDTKTSIRVNNGPEVPIDLKKGIDHPENAEAKEQIGGFIANAKRDMHKPANHSSDKLRLFIERVERLEEEIKGLNSDKSDVFQEMKGEGFDTKTIKRIIKLRKIEPHARQEAEALLETYMNALGMTPIEAAIALAA